MEDIFLREELTEVEEVGPNDFILATLGEQSTSDWNTILELNAEGTVIAQEFVRQKQLLEKISQRFEAKRFLFWDTIESQDERFESAKQRGKILFIKKDNDGKLVVVEQDAPQHPLSFLFAPPDQDRGE